MYGNPCNYFYNPVKQKMNLKRKVNYFICSVCSNAGISVQLRINGVINELLILAPQVQEAALPDIIGCGIEY